jgi:hypothetical protein
VAAKKLAKAILVSRGQHKIFLRDNAAVRGSLKNSEC